MLNIPLHGALHSVAGQHCMQQSNNADLRILALQCFRWIRDWHLALGYSSSKLSVIAREQQKQVMADCIREIRGMPQIGLGNKVRDPQGSAVPPKE